MEPPSRTPVTPVETPTPTPSLTASYGATAGASSEASVAAASALPQASQFTTPAAPLEPVSLPPTPPATGPPNKASEASASGMLINHSAPTGSPGQTKVEMNESGQRPFVFDESREMRLTRCHRKWRTMKARNLEHFYANYPQTFLRRLARGVPQEFRWEAWSVVLGLREIVYSDEPVYETLKTLIPPHNSPVPAESDSDTREPQHWLDAQPGREASGRDGNERNKSETAADDKNRSAETGDEERERRRGEKEGENERGSSEGDKKGRNDCDRNRDRERNGDREAEGEREGEGENEGDDDVLEMAKTMNARELYETLSVKRGKFTALIDIDITRTFPEIDAFDRQVQKKLQRVLNAYANLAPHVGYCQGMNFVTGFIFLVSNFAPEEECFYFLVVIMCRYHLHGFFREKFPLLNLYIKVYDSLARQYVPQLRSHFAQENVLPPVYLHQWYLTMFVTSLPLGTVVVVWDFVLATGLHGLIPLTLALLKVLQSFLLRLRFEGIVKFLRSLRSSGDCDESKIGKMLARQALSYPLTEDAYTRLIKVDWSQLLAQTVDIHPIQRSTIELQASAVDSGVNPFAIALKENIDLVVEDDDGDKQEGEGIPDSGVRDFTESPDAATDPKATVGAGAAGDINQASSSRGTKDKNKAKEKEREKEREKEKETERGREKEKLKEREKEKEKEKDIEADKRGKSDSSHPIEGTSNKEEPNVTHKSRRFLPKMMGRKS